MLPVMLYGDSPAFLLASGCCDIDPLLPDEGLLSAPSGGPRAARKPLKWVFANSLLLARIGDYARRWLSMTRRRRWAASLTAS
jgi:hypothetical protein